MGRNHLVCCPPFQMAKNEITRSFSIGTEVRFYVVCNKSWFDVDNSDAWMHVTNNTPDQFFLSDSPFSNENNVLFSFDHPSH